MRLVFVSRDGSVEAEGLPGERLLDAAQRAGQPLEGTCGGDMACATCHLILSPEDFARVPPAAAEEEDLLDLVPGTVRTSRLACQIVLTDALDGVTARVP
jgi:ferredoxin-2, mitochondrial